MASKTVTSDDIILFEPSDRSMLIEYPELANYPEFTKISPRDLKFVWYVANRTSPLINKAKTERVKRACQLAYDKKVIQNNPRIKDLYEKQIIPEDMVDAIKVMASFSPDFRMRAKLLNEYSFEMLQSLVYTETAITDIEDKKKYAELLIKVTSALQSMVMNMESSFGVKIKKEKQKEHEILASVNDIIDRVEIAKK